MTHSSRAPLLASMALACSLACSSGGDGKGTPACEAGQHACAGACVADASPATCGSRCEPCPATAHGQATCVVGACGVACDDGYTACDTGCCPAQPPGSVRFTLAWPGAGTPLADAARLEVKVGAGVATLDAPASAVTLEGLAAGRAVFALRLLDGAGRALARGGGVIHVDASETVVLPVATGSAWLSRCGIAEVVPGEDLVVDLSERRTLTVDARGEDGLALLLAPEELEWSPADSDVASVDRVTGEVTPAATGFVPVAVRCGIEVPSKPARARPGGALDASATLFVRDRTSSDAAPTAALAVDPTAADTDFTFRLDASGTADDGPASALRWRFDWEGDGEWDTSFGPRAVSFHRYGWPATYRPTVQVVDGGGHTGRAHLTLAVAEPSGVRVALSPETAWMWVRQTRAFTATVTGAADTSVTWSVLEGDAEAAGQCFTSGDTCHYDAPRFAGLYHLVATANADPAKKAIAEIDVWNQTPAADCHVEVGDGVWTDWAILGQRVVVDGARSRDAEDRALTYRWWVEDPPGAARVDRPETGASFSLGFDGPGTRRIGLDVTDSGGATGSNTCGDVTWAAAGGVPIGFWDDANARYEWALAVTGSGADTLAAHCEYDAGRSCWSRLSTESCTIATTGIGAPFLECGAGSAYVIGPESGTARLWLRLSSASAWRPAQPPATQVDVSVRGHSCLAGPFCR